MNWTIEYSIRARRSLKKLDNQVKKRIDRQLVDGLAKQKDPTAHPQVRTIEGMKALFRYRVGRYRVLFRVKANKLIIIVVDAGHRTEIYSGLKNIKEAEKRGFGLGDD